MRGLPTPPIDLPPSPQTHTNNHGFGLYGNNNTITNSLISSTGWLGTLVYTPVSMVGVGNSIFTSTVAGFGNAGVTHSGVNATVKMCHVLNGGMIGLDTAALYTHGWQAAGTLWVQNWVHDMTEKCVRGDDQSRNMTVHHNVCAGFFWGVLPCLCLGGKSLLHALPVCVRAHSSLFLCLGAELLLFANVCR